LNDKLELIQNYINFSKLLDPNIETISLTESKYRINIYFKESKKLCFSFEFECNKEKHIMIYQNIIIKGDNGTFKRKFYLLELFFTLPMRFDFRTIKLQNFPINRKEMTKYLDDYNKSYQKRVVPQKENFSKNNLHLQTGIYQITIVRKNHYIPQGYLRKFECEEKPGFIYNFKLDKDKFNETSGEKPVKIENILYLPHFYSLCMELILKDIEDTFYPIRNKIITTNTIESLSYKEKISIIRYIFAQYIRTPLERSRFVNIARVMLESIFFNQDNQGIEKDKIKIEFNEIYIRKMIEDEMFQFLFPSSEENQILKLIYFYLENKWRLIFAKQMKFYTSDNPIILYNNSFESLVDQNYIESLKTPNSKIFGTKRPHGLMESGIQLYFPISTDLCILIYDPQTNQRLLNPVEINEQILIQCYQNILSSNNKIRNFLKRKLNQKKKEREKFIELYINGQIEEY